MNKKITGNTMKLSHFHDFYFLEAIRAGLTMAKVANPDNAFRPAFEKLDTSVETAFEHLTKSMALRIYVYLWAAALGEARHARDMCPDYHIAELDHESRGTVYRMALDYMPTPENIGVLKAIYEQDWSSGFGGGSWLEIVEAMELYGNVPDATFIDHAVDLEHNGGNVFNKDALSAANLQNYGGYDCNDLMVFLNHKFVNDILAKRLRNTRTIAVSEKVHNLLVRYSNVVKPIEAVDFTDPSLDWLSAYSVNWGSETLELSDNEESDWQECAWCSNRIDPDEHEHYHDNCICNSCYTTKVVMCRKCQEDILSDETTSVFSGSHYEEWCPDCVANHAVTCEECGDDVDEEHNSIRTDDDETVCKDCAEKMYCEECEEYYYYLDAHNKNDHTDETIELPVDSDGIFSAFAMEAV